MAQLKDLLVNGKSKFLDMVTAVGMKLSAGGSDMTFWNTNGGMKTASEIVSAGISGGLTMANDNIQLTGSQLGLNSVLTGIGTISGSLVKISGDSSGSGVGVNISGKEIVLTGNEVTISTTSGRGSTRINFDDGSAYFGSGSAVITAYKTVISNGARNRVEVGSGSVYISGGSLVLMYGDNIWVNGKYIYMSGSNIYIGDYGTSLSIGSTLIMTGGVVNCLKNLTMSGSYSLSVGSGGIYLSGSLSMYGNSPVSISGQGNVDVKPYGKVTIAPNGSAVEIIGAPLNLYSTSSGSINIDQSGSNAGTTYLWGSVIARNNGIKLATSGSTVGCTMTYDATEECVKYTFS